MRALESIEQQTLDKSQYEIIVVKNFDDHEIDSKLQIMQAKTIVKRDEPIGMYLVSAIAKSLGNVLVFLDDDDEFEKNKLQIICDLFRQNANIGFVHNHRTIIDSQGNPLAQSSFRPAESRNILKVGSFRTVLPLLGTDANRLYRVSAFNYMSSISIRKEIPARFLDRLKDIESAQDYFMFYSSLSSKYDLAIISEKLTKIRLHKWNVSSFKYKSQVANLQASYMNHMKREIKSLEIILQTANEAHALHLVRRMILHDIWTRKVDQDMADPSCTRTIILFDLFRYLRYSFRATFHYQNIVILRSLISILFPNVARRMFVLQKIAKQ